MYKYIITSNIMSQSPTHLKDVGSFLVNCIVPIYYDYQHKCYSCVYSKGKYFETR